MTIFETYADYVAARLRGEEGLSRTACDGRALLPFVDDGGHCTVLTLSPDRATMADYHREGRRMMIDRFTEQVAHRLAEVLTEPIMHQGTRDRWEPFFAADADGRVIYDTFFDDYPLLTDFEGDVPYCRDLLKALSDAVRQLSLNSDAPLFLKSARFGACLPLLYVLQQVSPQLRPMPDYSDDAVLTNHTVVADDFPVGIRLRLGSHALPLSEAAHAPTLLLPLDEQSLNSPVAEPDSGHIHLKTWRQALADTTPTYVAGKARVKVLERLQLTTDDYQNVFMAKPDAHGREWVLLYSRHSLNPLTI